MTVRNQGCTFSCVYFGSRGKEAVHALLQKQILDEVMKTFLVCLKILETDLVLASLLQLPSGFIFTPMHFLCP